MSQHFIPAVFYRGGTSKGVFFNAKVLPEDRDTLSRMFVAALGSPDPYGRQLDGMGGGVSSLSKAVIIGPPTHPDADVDYTFIQIAVDQPVADWSNNCGNLSSAVGHFAVDEGLVAAKDGEALVRIHQTNTRKLIHSRFQVKDGKAQTQGDYVIAGVATPGSRIRLDFLDPDGAVTGKLLPSGNVVDTIDLGGDGRFEVSIVDATSLIVYVAATAFGLTGAETPDEIEASPGVMDKLEAIRRRTGVLLGLGANPEAVGLQTPRIAMVAVPVTFKALDGETFGPDQYDIGTRMISMQRAHKAIPGTGGLNLGVATQIAGTIPNRLSRPANAAGEVRVANPSGLVSVGAVVRQKDGMWTADSAVLFRTARRLMQGEVAIPASGGQ
ncbi:MULTISPECIES: 2-methylaconitate cis-trans isomerase PrpF family protein [Bosea]|uniref:2-methylaconitate cis-trans isomerase PrpF family protein n=1 Tax=Bosea TaxID=85413 RepID=UPI00214FE856|nr:MULTISPECIES: PrpF domain-containing protein [Bosea]MCR4524107.1 PrpF family protein [Bosea sp. 47.2.35]MDR6827485.1 2-methylaconitate cis-trans-isomerase PrpF [Bosea robiniae]MDR6894195.1 2-methylaconitate cis-trans-isomerase PrpF [Bosea sp. BE109]MDR7137590.1 2-methylaconitate cis-trans-isomerase PrpF [Bosea sp. BE168]MDR7174290.1 2-methylaconitate cis-trans-isomerase PrpF [Bosea sp. BE271]